MYVQVHERARLRGARPRENSERPLDVVDVEWQSVYLWLVGRFDYAGARVLSSAPAVNASPGRRRGRQASKTSAASSATSTMGHRSRCRAMPLDAMNGLATRQPSASGTRHAGAGRSCHTILAATTSRQRSYPCRYGANSSDT